MLNFGNKKNIGEVEITISNASVVKVLILTIISVLVFSSIRKASHALVLIFAAFILAIALNMPVQWLARRIPGKRRGNRTLATGISFLFITALLVGFLVSIVPPLVRQTDKFIHVAPSLIDNVHDKDSELGRFIRKYKLESQTDKLSTELSDKLDNISGNAVSAFTKTSSSIFSIITLLVLTFMMLIEGSNWVIFAKRLIPNKKLPHYEKITGDMYKVITGFVNGQVLLAALAAIMILVPLLALGISYPIALMVIVFIAGLIPLVGHTIGAVIVSVIALFNSPFAAIGILIYYITYQQIENYILQPKIQSISTNMSPLLVFSSVVVGVSLGGIFGGLLAIPVAGCLRILILDYLETRKLLSNTSED